MTLEIRARMSTGRRINWADEKQEYTTLTLTFGVPIMLAEKEVISWNFDCPEDSRHYGEFYNIAEELCDLSCDEELDYLLGALECVVKEIYWYSKDKPAAKDLLEWYMANKRQVDIDTALYRADQLEEKIERHEREAERLARIRMEWLSVAEELENVEEQTP